MNRLAAGALVAVKALPVASSAVTLNTVARFDLAGGGKVTPVSDEYGQQDGSGQEEDEADVRSFLKAEDSEANLHSMWAMSAVGVGMGLRYKLMPIESTAGPTAERPPTTTIGIEFHSVVFRDDSEAYNHYANGNWGGIVGVVRSAVVNSAL